MVEIQSKEVIDKISDELKVQPALKIPRDLMDKIQLVYNINPVLPNTVLADLQRTTTATAVTMFTAPAGKRTFITGVKFATYTNSTADNLQIFLTGVIGGATLRLMDFVKLTTVAISQTDSVMYPIPIEIDESSVVAFTNIFTVGASVTNIILFGFTTDIQ